MMNISFLTRVSTLLALLILLSVGASAQGALKVFGYCERGGQRVLSGGSQSTTTVQKTYPGCTVRVLDTGTATLTTIYTNDSLTPKSNPFTADSTTGYWEFWYVPAGQTRLDIQLSGGISPNNIASPFYWGTQVAGSGGGAATIENETYNGLPTAVTFRNKILVSSGLYAVDDPDEEATILRTSGVATRCTNAETEYYANPDNSRTTGTMTAGSTSITLTSLLNFKVGQWLRVDGLGVAGDHLIAQILALDRSTKIATLSIAATSNGTLVSVRPDNYWPIQQAGNTLTKATCLPNGYYEVYNPVGKPIYLRVATEGQPLKISGGGVQNTQIRFNGDGDGFATLPEISTDPDGGAITMSATNGSATLTCSACINPKWVGQSGSLVNVGATQDFVASVPNTSTITLLSAYSGSTGSVSVNVASNGEYHTVIIEGINFYAANGYTNPVTNKGWAINLGRATVVNHLRVRNSEFQGFRGGVFCSNCQGGQIDNNIFRGNKHIALGIVSDETTWISGNEPNIVNIFSNQFDFMPDPQTDSDVTISNVSSSANSRVLTAASSSFTSDMVGKLVRLVGAGTTGGDIMGIVERYDSPTQIVITARTNKVGVSNNKDLIVYKNPTALIYLMRSNYTTLTSNLTQGNFGSSPRDVTGLYIERSRHVLVQNHWSEQNGGGAGPHIDSKHNTNLRIEGFKTNSQGECIPSVGDPDQQCWDIRVLDSTIYAEGFSGSLSIKHFNLLDTTSKIYVSNSELGSPDFSNDNGRQQIIYDETVNFVQSPGLNRGTQALYDDTYGDNLVLNADFYKGLTSWTQVVPATATAKTDGSDRYKYYVRLDTTALPISTTIDTIFQQQVNIPDGRMGQNYVVAFDYRLHSYTGLTSPVYFMDVSIEPSTGGTGYNHPTTFRWPQLRSDNSSGYEVDRWNRAQIEVNLPAALATTGRYFIVKIRATRGPDTPVGDFTNFRVQQGSHAAGSNDQPITAIKGGRIRTASTVILDDLAGSGDRLIGVGNSGELKVLSGTITSGTVTSVQAALPASTFTVTSPAVTSSGTITATLNSQTANTVFSGPASGAAAAPTWRLLVANDIPTLDTSKIGTGILSVSRGGTGLNTATLNGTMMGTGSAWVISVIPSCSNGTTDKLLYNSGTQTFTCGVDQTSGGGAGITTLNTQTGATQTLSVTNDTNVTGSWTSAANNHALVLGWTGALAKARQHADTLYSSNNITMGAFDVDLGAANFMRVPVAAGAAPTVSGRIAYDSTANTWEVGANGNNRTLLFVSDLGTSISGTGPYEVNEAYAHTWTALHTWSLGTTPQTSIRLSSTDRSTNGTRNSHFLEFRGNGYDGAVNPNQIRMYSEVTDNTGNGNLLIQMNVDSGGWYDALRVIGAGGVRLPATTNGTPVDGDVWYDTGTLAFNFQENGVTKTLGGTALSDPGGNGVVVRTALNTTVARTLTGTSGKITVTNGDGTAGNPTFTVGADIVQNNQGNTWSTGAQDMGSATSFKVPVSAGAAPATNGFIAYDSTANALETAISGVNKTILMTDGSGASLTALNATQLTSGTVPLARLSGITNTEIAATGVANIALNKLAATTASRLLLSDSSGFITVSSVTATEAGYLSGVTSAIQTQLANRAILNGANTYTTGAQDFTLASSLTVVTTAAAAPTVSGQIGYNTTSNTWVVGVNGATKTILMTDGSGANLTSLNATQLTSGTVPLGRLSGITATELANNAVTDARLRDSSALSVIGRSANSTGDPADIAAANDGEVLRRSGTTLGFGTIATAGIADDAVTEAKIEALMRYSSNIVINGGGDFFQRQDPATLTSRSNDTYAGDRWYVLTQTAAIQTQRTTGDTKSTYAHRLKQNQASAQRMGYATIIEGSDSRAFRSRTVRFQGRINSSSSQAIRIAILEWTGTVDAVTSNVVNNWTSGTFTTGNFFNSTSLTLVGTSSVTPSASTWTSISVSGSVSASCNNLILFIWTEGTAAQNVTLDLTELGCYPGAAAREWLPRSTQQELALCQRYFFSPLDGSSAYGVIPSWGTASSTTRVQVNNIFPVTMRAAPSFSFTGNFRVDDAATATAATNLLVDALTSSVYSLFCDVASGLTAFRPYKLSANNDTTARVYFDAELE